MKQEEVQAAFIRFSAPLLSLVAMGADRESANELARNLWFALIGGPEVEEQVFAAMRAANSALYDEVERCYSEEMKPQVSAEELARLRERYRPEDPDA